MTILTFLLGVLGGLILARYLPDELRAKLIGRWDRRVDELKAELEKLKGKIED